MASEEKKTKELTGKHVLLIILVFFGIMFAVNIYFTYMAVTSFRGEDVKRSYRQGLDYNQTLESRAEQAALGWTVVANVQQSQLGKPELILQIDDARGKGLGGLNIDGQLVHRVDTYLDKEATIISTGGGRYKIELDGVTGPYKLKAIAKSGDNLFRFEHAFEVN